jgi:HPt (histidine-containing phosphotransfer) domain-containing protein
MTKPPTNSRSYQIGDEARDEKDADSLIDREGLMDRVDGDLELMGDLIDLFNSECPRLIGEMQTAAERGDLEAVRKSAHAFKGAVGNFSQSGAFIAAGRIEQLAASGDRPRAVALITDLEHEAQRLLDALRTLRS